MRVVLTSFYYKPHFGGVENSIFHLAKEATLLGHEVIIVASDADLNKKGRLGAVEVMDGVPVLRFRRFIPWIGLFHFFTAPVDLLRCYFFFKRQSFDVQHTIVIARHHICGLAAKWAGARLHYLVPGVVSYQEIFTLANSQANSWKERLRHWYIRHFLLSISLWVQQTLFAKADRLFVFSKNMVDQVKSELKKTREITITKPGVSYERFSSYTQEEARAKLSLPADKVIFLILGRLTVHKNIAMVIQAFTSAGPPSNALLLIVGDGPELQNLKREADQIEESVLFFKATTCPELFYIASNVFIMASKHEPFGQTIVEAMASGDLLIGIRFDPTHHQVATTEIMNDQDDYLLEPEQLGECIQKLSIDLSLNTSLANERGRKNKERAFKSYSWTKLMKELLDEEVKA